MTKKTLSALLAFVCAIPLFTGCHPGTAEEEKAAHLSYRYARPIPSPPGKLIPQIRGFWMTRRISETKYTMRP